MAEQEGRNPTSLPGSTDQSAIIANVNTDGCTEEMKDLTVLEGHTMPPADGKRFLSVIVTSMVLPGL